MDVRDDKAIETSESSETPKEKAQEMHTTAVVCGIPGMDQAVTRTSASVLSGIRGQHRFTSTR